MFIFCFFFIIYHTVYELQKQLTEIKNVMNNLRRNETCRTKKERILMDAYQLLNPDEIKPPPVDNRSRPVVRLVLTINYNEICFTKLFDNFFRRRRGRQNRVPAPVSATTASRPNSGNGAHSVRGKRSRSLI